MAVLGRPSPASTTTGHGANEVPAGKALDDAVRLPSEVSRARMLADQGQAGAALQHIEQVVEQATKRPPPDPILATTLHARATLLLAAGQKEEAAAAAQAALEIDRALHHPPSVADDHRLLGQIATAQNDTEKARHHTRRALNIFANTGQDQRAALARDTLLALPAEQQ